MPTTTRSTRDTTQRYLALLLIITLGVGVLWAVLPYVSGLFGAAILFVVLRPVHEYLVRRRIRPSISATLLVIATLLLILGPGASIVTVIATEMPSVIQRVIDSDAINRLNTWQIGTFRPGAHVAQAANALLSWAPARVLGAFAQVTAIILNILIALLGLYYLLISSNELWLRIRPMLPFSDENADLLCERFHSVTQATVLGTLLTAILQGSIVGAGFWIIGLPYALFWGVVTGFASILPVLGSALVWVPGVIVLIVQHRYGAAITLAVIGGVIASNIDNVVRPVVYKRVSNIHPMTTIVGAFAGVQLFGLVGVLLGPLAITLFFELADIYQREYDRA